MAFIRDLIGSKFGFILRLMQILELIPILELNLRSLI